MACVPGANTFPPMSEPTMAERTRGPLKAAQVRRSGDDLAQRSVEVFGANRRTGEKLSLRLAVNGLEHFFERAAIVAMRDLQRQHVPKA